MSEDEKTGGGRVGDVALCWWEGLKEDRGSRAQLRRCRDLTEIFFFPAFHELVRKLRSKGHSNRDRAAAIAGVLAHVKENRRDIEGGKSFAGEMAEPKQARALVSGLRFRRLLQKGGCEELFVPLIRIVHLMDGAVNVPDLAESIYYWGPKRRRDWACDYYRNAPQEEK
jgi:CRISPR system Cascade subunit CasB